MQNSRTLSLKALIAISVLLSVAVLVTGIVWGSVDIGIGDILRILGHKIFGANLGGDIKKSTISIIWSVRMPRVFTAFIVGASLSLSGVIMQAVLRNPLASSYTLGVSSGASLGVALIMVTGITSGILGHFLMPLTGFICGLLTVLLVLLFSYFTDNNMRGQSIILVGMVLSLFINAIITLISSFNREFTARITLWQMGTFSGRNWTHVAIGLVTLLVSATVLLFFTRELDILTFGEEQATTMGVRTTLVRNTVLIVVSLLTGVSVCLAGIIGFIDLIAPHLVRRVFGSSHKVVIPLSLLYGGSFMVIADLISRTITAPREIPVGAVTAIIGAPFFAYVFFRRKRS